MRRAVVNRIVVCATALVSLALAYVAWRAAESQAEGEARARFEFRVEEIARSLAGRMLDYEQVLRGAAGLFAASDEVTEAEWRTFVSLLDLPSSYPGIQGLAYAPYVREGDGSMVVRYIEPLARGNPQVRGFDMLKEPERRRAVLRARDTGEAVVTGRVQLRSESGGAEIPSFLMYLPLYSTGAMPAALEARRARFSGVVYAAFRAPDFFRGTIGRPPGLQLRLLDVSDPGNWKLLYDDEERSEDAHYERAEALIVRGRTWRLEARSQPAFEASMVGDRPRLVLSAALALAALVTALVWSLVNTRDQARELARRMVAAREERDRFRFAVERHPDTMLMVDVDTMKIVYANEGAAATLGYLREELVGQPAAMVFDDRDEKRLLSEYARLSASGEANELERGRFRRKDGRTVPVEVSREMLKTASGTFVLGVARDITARLEAERALRESESRLALSLESSGLAIFDWDLATNLVHLGKEWMQLLGGAPEATVTPVQKLERLVHPDDLPALREHIRGLLSGATDGYRVEHRVMMLTGEWKWIESVAKVSRRDANGRALRVTGTNGDITERKKLAEFKNAFIASVSHELRTPLTSILASLYLLKEGSAGELPEQARKFIDMAHANGERLAALISDILDLERIESGRLELTIRDMPARPLLAEVAELNQAYADKYQARIEVEAGDELALAADRDRLIQVLTNLVSNAAKFSPQGGRVRLRAVGAHHRVVLSVSDEGPGIPEEFRARLFGKFEQAEHDKGGTGLGLAISKAMVEKMGGHIACESAPAPGAVFTIDLPAAAS
jgi:PAS domain S-box-containing protein